MIDKYDLNQNGLSEQEISKMSLTGKLAVALARILKRSALKEEDTKSKALFLQIQDLSQNLSPPNSPLLTPPLSPPPPGLMKDGIVSH